MGFGASRRFFYRRLACIFRSRKLLACLIAVLFLSHEVFADVYFEVGDAGETLADATVVPAGVDVIHGALGFIPDVDLYRLTFGVSTTLTVSIPNPGLPSEPDWFDTDVTIFNASGNPMHVFDANSFSFSISPGTYFFAIADWNVYAADVNNVIIADDYSNVLNPSGVLHHWVVTSTPYRIGDYDILLSVSTVPEPSAFVLVGCCMLATAFRRRTRRS